MKSIVLIRHSYAEYSYNKNDFDRELTTEGFDRIRTQAQQLKNKSQKFDLIVTSSALRAKQTAEKLKTYLNINNNIVIEDWLYQDYTTQDLLELFQSFANQYQSVILIAHNPSISAMASNFSHSSNYIFNPCSILKLDFATDEWKNLNVRTGKEDFYLE